MLGKGIVAIGGVDFGPKPGDAATARQSWGQQPCPRRSSRSRSPRPAVSFGGFGYLEESLAEATYIADAYAAYRPDEPAPVLLTGRDATEGALKALAAPPRVLHLATHGYYLETGSIEGAAAPAVRHHARRR